jgi:hypothetical protein
MTIPQGLLERLPIAAALFDLAYEGSLGVEQIHPGMLEQRMQFADRSPIAQLPIRREVYRHPG